MSEERKGISSGERECPSCGRIVSTLRVTCPMCGDRIYKTLVEKERANNQNTLVGGEKTMETAIKAKKTKEEKIREAIEGPVELDDHEKRMVEQDPHIWRNWSNPRQRVTRGKAIRLKCLDCCCGSAYEVGLCRIITCALWPYRRGKENRTFPEWPKEIGAGE